MNNFTKELETLLNRYRMENASNTPDFILAEYMTNCLRAWNEATQQRETWYGRDARPMHGMLGNLQSRKAMDKLAELDEETGLNDTDTARN